MRRKRSAFCKRKQHLVCQNKQTGLRRLTCGCPCHIIWAARRRIVEVTREEFDFITRALNKEI